MHKEENFEDTIDRELQELSGYEKGNSDDYDPEIALFPTEIIQFIQKTQPQTWSRLASTSGGDTQQNIIDSLVKELKSRGMLEVLRSISLNTKREWYRKSMKTPSS